ncbi:hypothetical protein P4H94_28420 [Paenibacillus macerans]|uniref:hypothetical protein n=1 Tax=Paenibacillus macerans TaxID=44252 RepID=UPI001B0B99F5|nr:hypothetical protein [Paenibacillus macerans]MEC0140772.1 hypothetical protein [Paenibacillus macerans]GIP10452.1 hypothetical protein J1TS5_26220 [Paenibacillus macerans]
MKIKATFCRYCQTVRSDSNLDGKCRVCKMPLYEKEVELPELDNSEKEKASAAVSELRKNMMTWPV